MPDDLAQIFWQRCAAGTLGYQRCAACGCAQFYPRPFCARCGGAAAWVDSKGCGTVYAVTRVERAPSPDFAALVPYDILLVDLDEGFRMMAHGAPGLAIGDRVRVSFRSHGERALPYFRRDGEGTP
jgi:uncharacterized OB-fold protein